MNELILNKQKGFTIIEVVLVLAIAGLIFLTVFLALPALQKSQRDNARRQDVGKVIAGLQQYIADHDNGFPSPNWYTTGDSYFGSLAQATQTLVSGAGDCSRDLGEQSLTTVMIVQGCRCNESGQLNNAARRGYVRIRLESGSWYCKEFGSIN